MKSSDCFCCFSRFIPSKKWLFMTVIIVLNIPMIYFYMANIRQSLIDNNFFKYAQVPVARSLKSREIVMEKNIESESIERSSLPPLSKEDENSSGDNQSHGDNNNDDRGDDNDGETPTTSQFEYKFQLNETLISHPIDQCVYSTTNQDFNNSKY